MYILRCQKLKFFQIYILLMLVNWKDRLIRKGNRNCKNLANLSLIIKTNLYLIFPLSVFIRRNY